MRIARRVSHYLHSCDLRYRTIKHCAEAIGSSSATIERRLRQEGTRYSLLLEAERRRRCDLVLTRDPLVTIDQIADEIGYAERGSVRRAMKRWYGVSLSEMRRAA